MSRRTLIALSALVVVVVGGVAVWYVVLRDDAPPKADVDAVADGAGDGESAAGEGPDSADGTWTIQAGDTVFVGYRVEERFAGDTVKKTAAGRTPAVEGELVVDGDQVTSATIDADLTELTSDQERRDSALLTRGLQIEQFPNASFELTEPIALAAAPEQGETIQATATGDLTLHGQTQSVDIDLEGKWDGATISVAGDTPIAFADYRIEPIEIGGFVSTDDHGTLELQLLFVPA